MRNIIKFICSFICYVAFIPSVLCTSIGLTWYLLPAFQTTYLGQFIVSIIGESSIFIVTICSIICTLFFGIMGKVFLVIKNSKAMNFYTHLITWLTAICLSAEAVYSFIASNTIQSA